MTEKEPALMAQLPIKPFDLKTAMQVWKLPEAEVQKMLDDLAGKALLVDIEQEGKHMYVVPQPMAGFFEFLLMRVCHDIDQLTLRELFYQLRALCSNEKPNRALVYNTRMDKSVFYYM